MYNLIIYFSLITLTVIGHILGLNQLLNIPYFCFWLLCIAYLAMAILATEELIKAKIKKSNVFISFICLIVFIGYVVYYILDGSFVIAIVMTITQFVSFSLSSIIKENKEKFKL